MDEVDNYLVSEMRKQGIPGLSVVVLAEGRVVKMSGYGLANIEWGTPAAPETIYKLGSISKPFLALATILLIEDRKIGLADKVKDFFEGAPDAWSEITIQHLLTHTSGIVREAPAFDPYKIHLNSELIESTFGLPLLFAPGEKWEYSNVGYFILAEIIRVRGKMDYGAFLHARVFSPAEMSATRTTSVADIIPHRAHSYLTVRSRLCNAGDLLASRPSGAFVSNVIDLAKWDAALYCNKFITRETRERMETPVTLNDGSVFPYGFGWELANVNGHRLVRHGGALWCFRTELLRCVDVGLTVAVLSNHKDADSRDIALRVAGLYAKELVGSGLARERFDTEKWLEGFRE